MKVQHPSNLEGKSSVEKDEKFRNEISKEVGLVDAEILKVSVDLFNETVRVCACVCACVCLRVRVCVCVRLRKRERICTIASGHTSVCVNQDTDTFFNPWTGSTKQTRLVNRPFHL